MYKQHAELSASGAATWIRCPGSVLAQRGKSNPDSEYSMLGTAAHFLAAWCLQNNANTDACFSRSIALWKDPATGIKGEGFESELTLEQQELIYNRFDVTEDMVEHVQVYVDTVRDYAQHGRLFVEVRVPLTQITTEPDAEGTSDAIIVTDDGLEIIVVDLKYGQGVQVYSEGNEQMQMYALGALEWLDLAGLSETVKRVRLVISQPRKSPTPSEWDLTIEELRKFEVRANLSAIQGLSLTNDPVFNPGPKQCKWCRAKPDCAHAEKFAIGTVIDDFDIVGSDKDAVSGKLSVAAELLKTAENARLGWLLDHLAFIEDWTKAVRARAEERIFAGEDVPGYKVVQGKKGARAWKDVVAVEETMKSMRLKVDEMYDFKLISPTSADKLLAKTNPRKWERLTPLITQSEGNKAVVPLSDPRPAIAIVPVADAFETVEEPLA